MGEFMTRNDTKQLLFMIDACFPRTKYPDPKATLDAWSAALISYPAEDVFQAFKVYVLTETKGFAPSLGQLLSCMPTDLPTWDEVSLMIHRAIRHGLYNSTEEFKALPASVQRIVGSPNTLKEWAGMDAHAFETYKMVQIQRTYDAVMEAEKTRRAVQSGSVLVQQIAEQTAMRLTVNSEE